MEDSPENIRLSAAPGSMPSGCVRFLASNPADITAALPTNACKRRTLPYSCCLYHYPRVLEYELLERRSGMIVLAIVNRGGVTV